MIIIGGSVGVFLPLILMGFSIGEIGGGATAAGGAIAAGGDGGASTVSESVSETLESVVKTGDGLLVRSIGPARTGGAS